jgi:hypothetical protein
MLMKDVNGDMLPNSHNSQKNYFSGYCMCIVSVILRQIQIYTAGLSATLPILLQHEIVTAKLKKYTLPGSD